MNTSNPSHVYAASLVPKINSEDSCQHTVIIWILFSFTGSADWVILRYFELAKQPAASWLGKASGKTSYELFFNKRVLKLRREHKTVVIVSFVSPLARRQVKHKGDNSLYAVY